MAIADLTDKQIQDLIDIEKPLPSRYNRLHFRVRPYSAAHEEAQIQVQVVHVGTFKIMLRRNVIDRSDFSVILGVSLYRSPKLLRLRRYNGPSHEHTNKLEGQKFRAYHIHYATQRYQEMGAAIDKFAEPSEKFQNLEQALDLCYEQCNFIRPESDRMQARLF